MKMEMRTNQATLTSDGDLVVRGYVNKPGTLSQVLGSTKKFREKIAPGAFKKAIENRNREIDFLAEHDKNKVLASTRNNSLILREDPEGLYMEARITPTSYGKDYYTLISDGLVGSMSFGFRALKDNWELVEGMAIRTVHELELFEVSAVKDPAYLQSVISARGIDLVEDVEVPEELSDYSENKTNERGNDNMEIIETRTNVDEFEQILKGEIRSVANTTAEGATLIPENVAQEIVLKMEEVSPVFAKVRKFQSVAGSLRVARENDSVTGYFVDEGSSIPESAIAFKSVELKQKRVGAALTLTKQLILDSAVNVGDYAKGLLARRVAKTVEKSILTGTAANEFRGIIHDADIVANAVVEDSADRLTSLQEVLLKVHPEFLSGASFIMNRNYFNQLAKEKDEMGHFYIQNGVVNGKLTYTLFGMPIDITESLPDTNPVLFGNFTDAYSVMIKQEQGITEVSADTQTALAGTKLFVFDAYMDGAVTNPQAVAMLTVPATSA